MLNVEPGRERAFEAMRAWLQASAALDDVIASTEPPIPDEEFVRRPLPEALVRAYARQRTPQRGAAAKRLRLAPRPSDAG